MKNLAVLFGLCCLASSCATYMDQAPRAANMEGVAYLQRANETPLALTIPKDKAEEAWARVNIFITKYSSMKIQVSTAYSVETFNPPDTIHYGYAATKEPKGDEVTITVTCFSGGMMGGQKNIPTQNAHIFALYVLTGEINPEFIVR